MAGKGSSAYYRLGDRSYGFTNWSYDDGMMQEPRNRSCAPPDDVPDDSAVWPSAAPPDDLDVNEFESDSALEPIVSLTSAAGPLDLPSHDSQFPGLPKFQGNVRLAGNEWTTVPDCLTLAPGPRFTIRPRARPMDIVDVNAFAEGAKRKPPPPFGPLSSFIPGVSHPLYGEGAPFAHVDRLKGPKVIVMRHPKERRQTFTLGPIPPKPIDDWLRNDYGFDAPQESAAAQGEAAEQDKEAAEEGGEEEGGEEDGAEGEEDTSEQEGAEEEDEE
jgi:hypothetical protein